MIMGVLITVNWMGVAGPVSASAHVGVLECSRAVSLSPGGGGGRLMACLLDELSSWGSNTRTERGREQEEEWVSVCGSVCVCGWGTGTARPQTCIPVSSNGPLSLLKAHRRILRDGGRTAATMLLLKAPPQQDVESEGSPTPVARNRVVKTTLTCSPCAPTKASDCAWINDDEGQQQQQQKRKTENLKIIKESQTRSKRMKKKKKKQKRKKEKTR